MNKRPLMLGLVALLVAGVWLMFASRGAAPTPTPASTSDVVAPEAAVTIIAFGDSLTAGYGVTQAESYPAQLEKALRDKGYDVAVVNAGVSGETTRGNVERASFVRAQNPDIVLLGIGGNDALRALPIEETEKNLRATIDGLQEGEQAPRVVVLRMQAPLNAGAAYKERFDSLYDTIATEYGLVLVPFITEELFLDVDNKLPDGIHYNRLGYQKVIEQHLLPSLEPVLEETE